MVLALFLVRAPGTHRIKPYFNLLCRSRDLPLFRVGLFDPSLWASGALDTTFLGQFAALNKFVLFIKAPFPRLPRVLGRPFPPLGLGGRDPTRAHTGPTRSQGVALMGPIAKSTENC